VLAVLSRHSLRQALMAAISIVSTPSAPMRFLQRVRLDGSTGDSIWKWVSRAKNWQCRFSTQMLTANSSEQSCACCKYSTPRHQLGRQCQPADLARRVCGERALDLWLVNRIVQQHQLVFGVEVLRQRKAKQISRLGRLLPGTR